MSVTRLSSKGQVVIPASIRRRLNLAAGDELRVEIASTADRTIVLRAANRRDVESALRRGYAWIEERGEDLVTALHETRRRARERERRRR